MSISNLLIDSKQIILRVKNAHFIIYDVIRAYFPIYENAKSKSEKKITENLTYCTLRVSFRIELAILKIHVI